MRVFKLLVIAVFLLFAKIPASAQNNQGPPPLPPAAVQFWYAVGQQQRGPVTQDQLRELIGAGTITKQTLVWRKGMAGWTPAGEVDSLAVLFVPTDRPPVVPNNPWGQFIQGTWYMESKVQSIYSETYATYNADGSFTGSTSFFGDDIYNPGQKLLISTNRFEGTWSTKPMTGERFQLVLKYTKATDPNFKIPPNAVVAVLQRTGPHSIYNETSKFQARRVQ